MARCDLDAEQQAEINRLVPTFEQQIQVWANAPSNTASAAPVPPSEAGTQQAEDGCPRHRGDPHNLCEACMEAEQQAEEGTS